MRGLIAGALFGAEIYVPYLLIDEYDFSPTWAGLGLTAAALAWAVAADVQGRFGDRIGNARITLIGTALLFAARRDRGDHRDAPTCPPRCSSPAGRSPAAAWGSCIRG